MFQLQVDAHGEVDSTMRLAREAASRGVEAGYVVTATHQRAGRGRGGAQWTSEAGRGLWATFVLWASPTHASSSLSPLMALAVCRGVWALGVPTAGVKWPNDVLAPGGKLAGLLLEQGHSAKGRSYVLCGIGLNLWAPRAVAQAPAGKQALPALGLCEAGAPSTTTAQVALTALCDPIKEAYAQFLQDGFAPSCQAFDRAHLWRGRRVLALRAGPAGEDLCGMVGPIGADGSLTLRHEAGESRLISGSLRLADSSGA